MRNEKICLCTRDLSKTLELPMKVPASEDVTKLNFTVNLNPDGIHLEVWDVTKGLEEAESGATRYWLWSDLESFDPYCKCK